MRRRALPGTLGVAPGVPFGEIGAIADAVAPEPGDGEPVESPLGPQLLHHTKRGIDDHHRPE